MTKKGIKLKSGDISVSGRLYIPGAPPPYPLVCLCHGIPSGNPPEPGDGGYPALAERILSEGFAVCIFNFRGTGESGGNLDMTGWTQDLGTVIDYLTNRQELAISGLALVGFSAGAAVSVYVASHDDRVNAVAACACPAEFSLFHEAETTIEHFRSIGAIRDENFPSSPSAWLAGFKNINPIKFVDAIALRPLLIVHGQEDDLVSVDDAHRLYEKAGEPKEMVILEGAGHRLRRDERAVAAVIKWLNQYLHSI